MKMFSIILLSFIMISAVFAQNGDEVKKVDSEFSDYSKQYGMQEAFLKYADSDGVLLRPYNMPIVGIEKIREFLNAGSTDFVLTWTPLFGSVASSGELGYTYGTYEITFKDEQGKMITRTGTYITIWKKDSSGSWKFMLDTGNPGLEPKKE